MFHILRHGSLVVVTVAALGEPGLEVFLDTAIEQAESGGAAEPGNLCSPWPTLDLHP